MALQEEDINFRMVVSSQIAEYKYFLKVVKEVSKALGICVI